MNFKQWLLLTEAKKASDIARELLGNVAVLIDQIKSIIPKNIPEKLQGQLLPIAAFYHKQQPNLNTLKQDMQNYADLLKNQKIQMITVKDDLTIDGDFKSYIHWTEIIHGKKYEDEVLNAPVKGDVSDQDMIAQSTDGKIKVYKANSVNQCIILGRGESFCISKPANTMFQSYRDSKTSTFHFVYDNTRVDDLAIVVVDATKDKIELTDRKNRTARTMQDPYSTTEKRIDSDPDLYFKYLQEKGIDTTIFKNIPKSPEEEAEQEKLGKQNGSLIWFKSLTMAEKSKYIGRGHKISDEQFDYMYDNNFTLILQQYAKTGLKVSDHQLAKIAAKRDLRDFYLHNRLLQNQNHNDLSKQEYALLNPKQKEEYYSYFKGDKASMAIHFDDVEMAKEFVKNGEGNDSDGYVAGYTGDIDLLKYLIEKFGKLKNNAVDGAANAGNIEIVKYLTNPTGMFDENGKKIHDGLEINDSAVASAAGGGRLAMIKYLIDEKDMNVNDFAVSNAANNNHFDVVKYLFGDEVRDEQGNVYELPKQKITKIANSRDDWVKTSTMNSAFRSGNIELIKYLAAKLKTMSPEQHAKLLTMISQSLR